jgi:thermitase
MSLRIHRIVAVLVVCLLALSGGMAQAAGPVRPDAVAGEILLGLQPSADTPATLKRLLAGVGAQMKHQRALHVHRIKLRAGLSVDKAVTLLRKQAGVRYAEPNYIVRICSTPADPDYGLQYGPQKVQADLAWDIWQPQAQTIIAIIDTGVDSTHPDLTNKICRDAGGILGYDAINRVRDDGMDDHGHGTHCAGTAAAETNNGIGMAGIAGWNGLAGSDTTFIRIMPVKVLDGFGSGTWDDVADGMVWAADNGARVLSMSLGGFGDTQVTRDAAAYAWSKNCLVVAAAGNAATDIPFYPASYPNVLSVAATDDTDTLANFSNYGSWVLTAAPGVNTYATTPTYAAGGGFALDYDYLSGTSMACPHVAGEAALIWAQYPLLANVDITNIITANVDPYVPFFGAEIAPGAGRINIYRALQAAATVVPHPWPPTDLSAVAGDGQVMLSWGPGANADSYNVKRSDVPGGPYVTIATDLTTTDYIDTGLTNGTTYYYVVTSVNVAGESAESNQAQATPQPPPTIAFYAVNNGSLYTASRWVTLDNISQGAPQWYMASELPDFSDADWQPYNPAPAFQLSAGNGIKTVYFKIMNGSGESEVVSDIVNLMEKPVVLSYALNGGAASTASKTITLDNDCSGNPTHYIASENSSFHGAKWKAYSANPSFALSKGIGNKRVWFKVRNVAGESTSVNRIIFSSTK